MNNEQKETHKRTFQKSRPYPPSDIEEALEFAGIVEKLGARNVSEQILLKELGLTNPTTTSFWAKKTSAKHFGFIIVDGKSYTLTERSGQILRPKDEDSKKNLLVESFLEPVLYKDLWDKFQGKHVPPTETLANILLHDHGINVHVSRDAARAFIDSAKYVGLLGPDNVLKSSRINGETALIGEKDAGALKQGPVSIPGTVMATIKLSKGPASIAVPEGGITKKDSERLKKLIDAYVAEETVNGG